MTMPMRRSEQVVNIFFPRAAVLFSLRISFCHFDEFVTSHDRTRFNLLSHHTTTSPQVIPLGNVGDLPTKAGKKAAAKKRKSEDGADGDASDIAEDVDSQEERTKAQHEMDE